MLTISKPKNQSGIKLQGDFFDLDRLYFAIFKLTGQFGIGMKCPFDGYSNLSEYVLALCYEIRHAIQGDRELIGVYNGVRQEWYEDDADDDDADDDEDKDNDEDDDDDDDDEDDINYDEDGADSKIEALHHGDYSKLGKDGLLKYFSNENAYYSTDMSIPEAMFHAWVLEDIIVQIDELKNYLLKSNNYALKDLNREYAVSKYKEDVALVSLYIGKMWTILYRVLGHSDYMKLQKIYQTQKAQRNQLLCKNYNTEKISQLIEEYSLKTKQGENPKLLLKTLLLMINQN